MYKTDYVITWDFSDKDAPCIDISKVCKAEDTRDLLCMQIASFSESIGVISLQQLIADAELDSLHKQLVSAENLISAQKQKLRDIEVAEEVEGNEPLTLEELKASNASRANPLPVYIVGIDADGGLWYQFGEWQAFDGHYFYAPNCCDVLSNYGTSFVAFRKEPQEADAE